MAVQLIYARKNLQDKTGLRASNRYTCLGLMSRMLMTMHGLRSLTQLCLPDTVGQRASFPNTGHPCTFLAFPNSALKCLVLTLTSTVTPGLQPYHFQELGTPASTAQDCLSNLLPPWIPVTVRFTRHDLMVPITPRRTLSLPSIHRPQSWM